ncbi:Serine/threonine-protein kinase Nek1 [Tetrabaena socialis]|uniref:non-specific serine/threonine protein kinase n=1 Tax=Tetrabaena socialis TaxID=47790 RepID=A0A2J7ZJ51_9CHLO|nr:Serine/threonine-protein kinase Nek1 [Tetrabaena socialis]|eukprot:PNH00293.1 Serine/threonine-protein kinase Nek1 [Tetrabaena socialis]
MFFGSFVDRGIKELVDSADPTLHISQTAVSERYELGEEIGSGSHGRAILARRIEDGKEVVVKQIRLYEMDDKNRQDTLTEARVLAQFNHVNIVHYHECLLEAAAGGPGPEAPDPPDRSASMDSTLPSISGSSLGSGVGSSTAAKAKLAEMKLQRDAELETQRRAIAAQREQKKGPPGGIDITAHVLSASALAVRTRALGPGASVCAMAQGCSR